MPEPQREILRNPTTGETATWVLEPETGTYIRESEWVAKQKTHTQSREEKEPEWNPVRKFVSSSPTLSGIYDTVTNPDTHGSIFRGAAGMGGTALGALTGNPYAAVGVGALANAGMGRIQESTTAFGSPPENPITSA